MSVIDEATLLKMAEAEILGEAKRAAVRHSIAGVSGWQPCSKLNKTFLTNTLLQTMAQNRILTRKKGEKKKIHKKHERKLLQKTGTQQVNYTYQKPKKSKEKLLFSTNSKKSNVEKNRSEKSTSLVQKTKEKSRTKT